MQIKCFVQGAILLGAVLLSGCMQMGAGATGSSLPITTKDSYTVLGDAKGTASALGIFGLQLWPTSAYDALQDAKKTANADGIINIVANNKVWYIPPVFPILTWHQMELRGEAIKFQRGGGVK